MKFNRTTEERFQHLKDYPFEPHYLQINELRMHFVDEGSRQGQVILMLHGEPSWSYLYRHMIPLCVAAGHRVIAPDLIGFGKSDKPEKIKDYSYQKHMDWMTNFIESLDLQNIVLVCQDWGALIGLRLAAENQQRFAGIVVGNGMLPTGDQKMPRIFKIWQFFARFSPWFPIDRIIESGCFKTLHAEEKRAYNAPFPSAAYKAGARAFPRLVPVTPKDPATSANRDAWEILKKWHKPFLTAFSNGDPMMRGGDLFMQQRIPGCKGQKHLTLKGGHFLQEDSGKEFATVINQFVDNLKQN